MMKICILIAIVAAATALPSESDYAWEDAVVPEMSLIQAKEEYSAHAAAVEQIKFLQEKAGKNENACKELAEDMIEEVENSITASVTILTKLSTGKHCKHEGQEAVEIALNKKKTAETKYTIAVQKLKDAENYEVDFGSYSFKSLTEGQCGQFFAEENYVTAKATFVKRTEELSIAKGVVKSTTEAYELAVKAAAEAYRKCSCKVKAEHKKEWKIANKDNDLHAKNWKKAKHMLCVLNDTPEASCDTSGMPTLTKPVLPADVVAALCNSVSSTSTQVCPRENGFCVKSNGADQNSGVVKIDALSNYGTSEEARHACLAKCHARADATGCEVIWNQGNRGCYAMTQAVARGNGVGNHYCWIFSKCETGGLPAPEEEPEGPLTGDYVGCFKDCQGGKRDLPVRKSNGSKDSCASQCKGYKYFGRQWTKECWCGNSYGSQGSMSGQCARGASNIGACRNAVYHT